MELKTIPELLKEDRQARIAARAALPTLDEIYRQIEAEMAETGKHFNDC